MKKIALMLCISASILFFVPYSGAAIINFESLAHNDDMVVEQGAVYIEQGYLLANTATEANSGFAPSFATFGAQAEGFTGSTALFNNNYMGTTVLSQIGGGLFRLNSISLSELSPYSTESQDVTFTGLLSNGNTVSERFSLDGLFGAQSFSFASSFTNLVSVSWDQTPDFHQFDNISVNAVPEPGTLLLLSSGLYGAIIAGRKYRSAAAA
jgi:hypothetical protein